MGDKLFVIGGDTYHHTGDCEVYEWVSKKFSWIEQLSYDYCYYPDGVAHTFCVGNKIVVIENWSENSVYYFVYDVDKNSWSAQEKHLV